MVVAKKTLNLDGIPVCPGLTFGVARVVYSWEQTIEERDIEESEVENEIFRFKKAVEDSLTEIRKWRPYRRTGGADFRKSDNDCFG